MNFKSKGRYDMMPRVQLTHESPNMTELKNDTFLRALLRQDVDYTPI